MFYIGLFKEVVAERNLHKSLGVLSEGDGIRRFVEIDDRRRRIVAILDFLVFGGAGLCVRLHLRLFEQRVDLLVLESGMERVDVGIIREIRSDLAGVGDIVGPERRAALIVLGAVFRGAG